MPTKTRGAIRVFLSYFPRVVVPFGPLAFELRLCENPRDTIMAHVRTRVVDLVDPALGVSQLELWVVWKYLFDPIVETLGELIAFTMNSSNPAVKSCVAQLLL